MSHVFKRLMRMLVEICGQYVNFPSDATYGFVYDLRLSGTVRRGSGSGLYSMFCAVLIVPMNPF